MSRRGSRGIGTRRQRAATTALGIAITLLGSANASALNVNENGMTLAAVSETVVAPNTDDELVKQLANPVSSLISVPFQNNFEFNLGPNDDGFKYTLNFQPVIPVSLNRDWNVIIRTIVPFVHQDDVIPGTTQDGLSDITQSFFLSPTKPVGGLILGVGPVFLYPSATDNLLGSEKWGAGPTLVVAKQSGGLTYGILANQIWSFAGETDRHYVGSTFLQPFLSYAAKTKTTYGINAESTYDWHNHQWTVPINLSVSQLTKIGNLPVQFAVGAKIYVEGPDGAPDWGLRFTVTPLFPTGGKR
jgi:hypothetical protein